MLLSTKSVPKPILTKPNHKHYFKVLLLNDNIHYKTQVINILMRTFNDMNHIEANDKTEEAHKQGQSILRIYPQYQAEQFCETLHSHSLKSIIEPVL